MPSDFFKSLPQEEQEKLKQVVHSQMERNGELHKTPFGEVAITSQDIDEWSNEKRSEQNNFNNSNPNNNGR